jgi:hypothetical protein
MFCDQVAEQLSKGVTMLLFRKRLGYITGHGTRSASAHFPLDPGKLLFWQGYSDLRHCHTDIIPFSSFTTQCG